MYTVQWKKCDIKHIDLIYSKYIKSHKKDS